MAAINPDPSCNTISREVPGSFPGVSTLVERISVGSTVRSREAVLGIVALLWSRTTSGLEMAHHIPPFTYNVMIRVLLENMSCIY